MSNETSSIEHITPPAKTVPWVELYFDLVVVFAIKQLAEGIAHHPTVSTLIYGLLMFLLLWWSWIGFTLLYNRWGNADRRSDVLGLLIATLPMTVIALGFTSAFDGDQRLLCIGMAASRVLLAVLNGIAYKNVKNIWIGRISSTYLFTAALFSLAAMFDHFWVFIVGTIFALTLESGALLTQYRTVDEAISAHQRRGNNIEGRRHHAARKRRWIREQRVKYGADLGVGMELLTVNPAHLAERFHLFLIIILGEIIVATGSGASHLMHHTWGFLGALVAGLLLAACLGWLYFQRNAAANEHYVESAQGGAAAVARNIYARGLIFPAFGLLLVASGIEASLGEHPEPGSLLPLAMGVTLFLTGNMRFKAARDAQRNQSSRMAVLVSWAIIAGSAALAYLDLHGNLHPTLGLGLIAAWSLFWTAGEGVVREICERKAHTASTKV